MAISIAGHGWIGLNLVRGRIWIVLGRVCLLRFGNSSLLRALNRVVGRCVGGGAL